MLLKTFSGAAIALSAASLFASAVAAPVLDPVAAAKARHEHFHQIGAAMKAIYGEVQKPDASIPVIQANAKTMEALADQLPTWFPAGTGPEAAPKTHALPTVWQKPAEFKKDAADFSVAAHAFNTAAASGNLDAIKGAFPALGGSCKTCHETFRAREEH